MHLKIDEGFPRHPKTLRFCRALGDPNAGMYLLRLWTWACRSAPDGNLTELEPEDIEQALDWRGEPGRCYRAIVASGFIDDVVERDGEELKVHRYIHNWAERTGGDIEKMEAEAERKRELDRTRQRRHRDAQKTPAPSGHAPVTRDTSVTSRDVTHPGQARPGQTRQERSEHTQSAREPDEPASAEPTAMQTREVVVAEVVNRLPTMRTPATAYDLLCTFAILRGDALNMPNHQRPSGTKNADKADRFLEDIRGDVEALADIRPTIQLFFQEARTDPKRQFLEDPSSGFGAWIHRFAGLRERLRAPPAAPLHPKDVQMARFLSGEG